jgi:signal transduction histidine kinase
METHMEEYLKLKQLIEEVADDVYKAQGGNKAAGTRVRKIMQDIKNTAQDVRKRVLELRSDEEGTEEGS